jgi:polyisoprenoid-binding protein YceI
MDESTFDASDGELLIHTDVGGPAARMGHRLTIAMTSWRAKVQWTGEHPTAVKLAVGVDSLKVLRGQGGVKALSAPEKALASANALKSLDAQRFPEIQFDAHEIDPIDGGYRLTGALQIHGRSRDHVVDLQVEDMGETWRISCQTEVRQTDFGINPYSMLMGSMKVADAVTVSFTAPRVSTSRRS